ncbi:MAG: type II 3-dehydroquinate dehydratase [Pseudomonadota bacterium]
MAATPQRILVLNGPNLNLTGTREPERYGSTSLADIVARLESAAAVRGAELEHVQSNAEHELIDTVHASATIGTTGLIINAGALTHTSIGLRDALLAVGLPFIEVHMSNVYAREAFRQVSYLSDIATGVIVGLGADGYTLALTALLDAADPNN